MADILLPRNLRHARTSFRYLDSTGVSRSVFTGATVTAARGGDRLGATLEFTRHGGRSTDGKSERALLRSFLTSLRGRQNRAYLYDLSYRRRGSFPTGELLPNNTFVNGTTGWSGDSLVALSVGDRILRVQRAANGASNALYMTSASTVVQYAPYIARAMLGTGNAGGTMAVTLGSSQGSNDHGSVSSGFGLATLVAASFTTSTWFGVEELTSNGVAGDYFTIPYVSLSRGAAVDNRPNLLLRSDEFDNASWTKTRCSASANATTAPDGTATADRLIEDSTASSSHFAIQSVTVSGSAGDYAFTVSLKAGTRTRAAIAIVESVSSHEARAWIDLSNGTIGTTSTTGSNWTNVRAFVVDMGGGWYRLTFVAHKVSAATTLQPYIALATADAVLDYSGDGASYISAWRATLANSMYPTALSSTGSAATTGAMQTGSGLTIKGLPVSTAGLLEVDDQVEIVTSRGSELKILTSRLNSDAAGLGYLQFDPPMRTSPSDGAAIVVHQPMGRFLFAGDAVGWDNEPGLWSSASAEFEEAV